MPRLELSNGGVIHTTDASVDPARLAITDKFGTVAEVELASLQEIESVVKLIEEPEAFPEEE